ncbi:MAG: glutamate 5-kinase [Chloroflexi bacterium]|nr:glutamate 5-kinase [Chloroflexota bacterium]
MEKPLVYDRIVVKAGTRLLTGGSDRLDLGQMATLVGQMARLHQKGVQVLLVSSGAVAAGRQALGLPRERKEIPFRQVLAAVGQARLMQAYENLFAEHEITVAQALLTRGDVADRLGYLNIRNTLLALLDVRVIPIINENDVVAVEELQGEIFGDNDNLSAMVANLVDADLLVMLGEVEGMYTADPHRDPNAHLIERVEKIDAPIESLAGGSSDSQARGGMATKIEAARLATASGVATVIASGHQSDVLIRLAYGESLGTFFHPAANKMDSRKRWMLSGLSTRGQIVVDAGAVIALSNSHRSLLPAGVKKVKGSFNRGDIIAILDSQGLQLACGIANYGSQDIAIIRGQRSDHIEKLLGYHYGDEIVHRNNMVLL